MLLAPAGPNQEKAAACTGVPASAVSEEVPLAATTSVRSGRIRVVIADDHRILRQGLIALLRVEKNIDVVGEAADGVEAVELARSLRPDVIIMDVSMPKMSGIDATRQIVAELPDVRVVGLSMHEDETIAASMRQAGAVDFVTKGGRSDALISAIRAAVLAHSKGRAG
jgi:DNA-binding NarL/FixJ family response regulator